MLRYLMLLQAGSALSAVFASLAKQLELEKVKVNEAVFRWELNEDQMATDKLSDGIRKFAADAVKLENILKEKLK